MPGFEFVSEDGIFFDILIYNKTEDAVDIPLPHLANPSY